jgi:formylglycine-generating enzyme required for sulfatase activity
MPPNIIDGSKGWPREILLEMIKSSSYETPVMGLKYWGDEPSVTVRRINLHGKPHIEKTYQGNLSHFSSVEEINLTITGGLNELKGRLIHAARLENQALQDGQKQKTICTPWAGFDLEQWFTLLNSPQSPFLKSRFLLALLKGSLQALEAFHALGFVHMDLHSRNIVLPIRANQNKQYTLNLDRPVIIDLEFMMTPLKRNKHISVNVERNGWFDGTERPIFLTPRNHSEWVCPALLQHIGLPEYNLLSTRHRRYVGQVTKGNKESLDLSKVLLKTPNPWAHLKQVDWGVDLFTLADTFEVLLETSKEAYTFYDKKRQKLPEIDAAADSLLAALIIDLRRHNQLVAVEDNPRQNQPHRAMIARIEQLISGTGWDEYAVSIPELSQEQIAPASATAILQANPTFMTTTDGDEGDEQTAALVKQLKTELNALKLRNQDLEPQSDELNKISAQLQAVNAHNAALHAKADELDKQQGQLALQLQAKEQVRKQQQQALADAQAELAQSKSRNEQLQKQLQAAQALATKPAVPSPPTLIVPAKPKLITLDQLLPGQPKMIALKQGRFTMGDKAWTYSKPHSVVVDYPLTMAETPITVAQWRAYVEATKNSVKHDMTWQKPGFTIAEDHPVTCVTWVEVQAFLTWLNLQAKLDDKHPARWRLPTESEWEYACRAGTTSAFSMGDIIQPEQAQYDWTRSWNKSAVRSTAPKGTAAVKSFAPNPWGLYDMHGNVWEWVADGFDASEYDNRIRQAEGRDWPAHKTSPEVGACRRVLRGGSWSSNPNGLRSANRYYDDPSTRDNFVGFRVARTAVGL